MQYGNRNGGPPGWTPPSEWAPPGMQASLTPPTRFQRAMEGLEWYQRQVYYATPWFPDAPNIGIQPRLRPIEDVVNEAVNATIPRVVRVDIPYEVYAMTGSAVPTTGNALPNNLHPLDTFLVQLTHNTGDRLVTSPTLARTVLGTAEKPGHIGGAGWSFDRGGTIQINVTPLFANLRISVTMWGIEVRGPTNIQKP